MVCCSASGNGPTYWMPGKWISSLTSWKPISASPFAISSPIGDPEGGVRNLGLSSASTPSFSSRLVMYTPLGPVEMPMVFAVASVRFNASGELTSGLGAPARTAAPTSARATSLRLPAISLPVSVSSSFQFDGRITASNTSPAFIRFIASATPDQVVATLLPLAFSNCGTSAR